MKIELEELIPYLPYDLNVASGDEYDKELPNIGVMGTHYYIHTPNNYTIYQLCECENSLFKYMGVTYVQVKPILRPLFSITKEEAKELMNIIITDDIINQVYIDIINNLIVFKSSETHGDYIVSIDIDNGAIDAIYEDYGLLSPSYPVPYKVYEWLFKHHFDIFGLIEKGLAIKK